VKEALNFQLSKILAELELISSSAMAERPRELGDFKKAQVNGGTDNHSLKGFSQVSPHMLAR